MTKVWVDLSSMCYPEVSEFDLELYRFKARWMVSYYDFLSSSNP